VQRCIQVERYGARLHDNAGSAIFLFPFVQLRPVAAKKEVISLYDCPPQPDVRSPTKLHRGLIPEVSEKVDGRRRTGDRQSVGASNVARVHRRSFDRILNSLTCRVLIRPATAALLTRWNITGSAWLRSASQLVSDSAVPRALRCQRIASGGQGHRRPAIIRGGRSVRWRVSRNRCIRGHRPRAVHGPNGSRARPAALRSWRDRVQSPHLPPWR
jgi:hypothetical protein